MASFVFSTALSSVKNLNIKENFSNFSSSQINKIYDFYNDDVQYKKNKIIGKLNELSIQTSTYNKIIPVIYGTVRLAGNIIWMSDIREVKEETVNTVRTGKNSKTKQKMMNYYYFASFAIAICKGEIESIKNVWVNTELLNLANYRHRIYYGTSTQEPDTLIQAIEGVGKCTAYRDICYIVFEDFPLSDFGNRIPNFTFEVKRKELFDKNDENLLENMITGVNLIPGSGEFAYDTEITDKVKNIIVNGYLYDDYEEKQTLNKNNNENVADCILSLNQLQNDLPNCKWVAPVVGWFGSSLDISTCTIKPKIEYPEIDGHIFFKNTPNDWQVGNYTRKNADLVSSDNCSIRYGGTPSDSSVLNLLKNLRERNLKIMFYPMIFMDIENKPWRGYLTGNYNNIENFYNNQYKPFILHYANLVKDYADCFIIGSELKGLTSIKDENNNFPFVDKLIDLANECRKILGNNVKISYAADWSEYHHTDGGWYNMDKLWASDNIDFVGIDAYFPLTDSDDINITKDTIKKGWESGEYYDFYYDNYNKKQNLQPQYAIKNIKWWWENNHINPDNTQTDWQAKSKKIWFTEYGFASVDGTTNEPSKFYDNTSIDGGFPKLSKGISDFYTQRKALHATEEYWKNSEFVENKFVWCWDARPYPYFPNLKNVWADCDNWKYGHWLNGKVKLSEAKNVISQVLKDANITTNCINTIDIEDTINGLALNNCVDIEDVLDILKEVYFFDYIESNGKINFLSNKNTTREKIIINENDLVLFKSNGNETFIKIKESSINDLPKKYQINFIDKDLNYDSNFIYSERETNETCNTIIDTIPVVLDKNKAKNVVETQLYLEWLKQKEFSFILPFKYIYLEVGDIIQLHNYDLKIKELYINEDLTINITANLYDSSIYDNVSNKTDITNNITLQEDVGNTRLNVFELPAINNDMLDKNFIFFTMNGEKNSWKGANLYYSENFDNNYKFIDNSNENSTVGYLLNNLKTTKPYYFDLENTLQIQFHPKIDINLLNSCSELDLYNGSNLALLGNEIIQFKNITLNSDGSYSLNHLLRGLFGTEKYINSHKIGDKLIIMNNNILKQNIDINQINMHNEYKAVSIENDFLTTEKTTYCSKGTNLKPLAPCHLNYKIMNNILYLSWLRRDRGVQNWRDNIDNYLVEKNEKYYLEFKKDNNIIKTDYTTKNSYNYDMSQTTLPITIEICQVNDYVGNGEKNIIKIN